jgi:hypothetical protein
VTVTCQEKAFLTVKCVCTFQSDWDELADKLAKLEENCKASWDHLRAICKHDSNIVLKIRQAAIFVLFISYCSVLKHEDGFRVDLIGVFYVSIW